MRRWGQCGVALALILMLCAFFYPSDGGELGEKVFAIQLPALFAGQTDALKDTQWLEIYDKSAGKCRRMALEEYVLGVVLAEMPADYADEAIKAQAVAARTYAVHKCARFGGSGCQSHADADVCTDSGCCQGYVELDALVKKRGAEQALRALERFRALVKETAGEIVTFKGAPILALYHACAGGQTENAEDVYTRALAYLRGVPSPGETEYAQYAETQTIQMTALRAAFQGVKDVILSANLPLSDQLEVLERTSTGRVASIRVGLAVLTGAEFRRITGLRSSNFRMRIEGNAAIFETYGYGHGVGMSQTGADAMARKGSTYTEILKWYYTDIDVAHIDALAQQEA